MKKMQGWILAAMLLMGLTGCGRENTAPTQTAPPSTAAPETTTAESTAPAPAFQPVTAVDNEFCTIRVTGLDPDNLWGYTLKVSLENKSEDTSYMFSVSSASLNGVEANPLFASEVAPGKKANKEISFGASDLQEKEIGDYTDIGLRFRVYDANDWSAEPVAEPSVHIYPYGEEKAEKFVRTPQSGDTVLEDNDQIRITVTGYRQEDAWGYSADLFLENKTEESLMVSIDEASINGFMADPFYAETVGGGNCAFSSITWSADDLEENGIAQVEELEFKLRVYPAEDWMAEDLVNKVITLTP